MKQTRHISWADTFQKGEYGCDGRDIKYEWQVEKILTSTPATLMIGGEEKDRQPFYPPETIAMTIADILGKWCPSVTVCIYRAAALAFNGVSSEAYYSEKEQQERILSRLADLDVDPELLAKITFVASEEDEQTWAMIQSFLRYPENPDPVVDRLEKLYLSDESFKTAVDATVLKSFWGNKNAYKYTLFELAMILTRKPAIKAGDTREKKYDEIVRKYRVELWWGLSEGEEKNQKPFQVIYWNRDNTRDKYSHYTTQKRMHQTESQLQRQSQKIQSLRRWCMGAAAAIVALPWFAYYLGKIRSITDDRYAALQEMHGRDDQFYDHFQQSLTGHWHNIGLRDSSFLEHIRDNSLLLHEGIQKRDADGLPNQLFHETISKNALRYRIQLTDEITSPAKTFWLGRDSARFAVYEKMVSEVVESYIFHEKFDSYESFSRTVRLSPLLLAAHKFLMAPLVDPVRIAGTKYNTEFETGLQEWYQLQSQELRHDAELGRQYLISYDMFGEYFVGPDCYFPENRETLMMLCESFYPRGVIARNFDIATIKKIHALYHALLPILEKNQWENFQYYGVAIDVLKKSPEVIQILGLFGFSIEHFDLPSTRSYISDWSISSSGRIPIAEPDAVSLEVHQKTQKWIKEHWPQEMDSMRKMGAYTPLEVVQKLAQERK